MKLQIVCILAAFLGIFGGQAYSQCEVGENKFFKPGENLTYDLYFKYGIITSKAGHASLFTQRTRYNNDSAYKMSLVSHSTGAARKFFKLDDTLACFMSLKLRPLAFWKDAHEGDEHTVERQTYSYLPNGEIKIQARRVKNGEERHNVTLMTNRCTYDMMSIVYYARTLDYENMKKDSKTNVVFISGRNKVNMQVQYLGIEKVKANNGQSYSCHKLSLAILDDAFTNKEDAMKVYITNDLNRVPIQIESKLKVGSTRATLKTYAGLMNPVGSN
ncbi:MAG: hypothetical protein BGN96_09545 [Bacteroidales bacterium 45-6]|nr:MAG: hypothetical protein BGN96_09545 [Bacteroidales bacterium 45-6]